jgi:hypothetical protein
MHIHTHTHTYTYTYTHTYTHTCILRHTYTYIRTHIHTHTYVHTHMHIETYLLLRNAEVESVACVVFDDEQNACVGGLCVCVCASVRERKAERVAYERYVAVHRHTHTYSSIPRVRWPRECCLRWGRRTRLHTLQRCTCHGRRSCGSRV